MGDVANQDEAKKCLEIASSNLQSGHLDKATRFAEKAMKLYPNDEVIFILLTPAGKRWQTSLDTLETCNDSNLELTLCSHPKASIFAGSR